MVSWYEIFEPKVKMWEDRRDLQKLIAGLADPDTEVRCLAYDALGRLRVEDTRAAICRALAAEQAPSARSRAAIALGRLGGGQAAVQLCQLLNDDAPEVRAAAVRGLGRLHEIDLLSVFCAMLNDDHIDVVVEAIYALSQLGHYSAVTSLHRLFDRADKALRELASNAINSINLKQPLAGPVDEVYFFTYIFGARLYCECYSYKLVAWRNYLRRRWKYPFAREWGIGYWEIDTLAQHLKNELLPPGCKLELRDCRA